MLSRRSCATLAAANSLRPVTRRALEQGHFDRPPTLESDPLLEPLRAVLAGAESDASDETPVDLSPLGIFGKEAADV